jgi:hypothetical protein
MEAAKRKVISLERGEEREETQTKIALKLIKRGLNRPLAN